VFRSGSTFIPLMQVLQVRFTLCSTLLVGCMVAGGSVARAFNPEDVVTLAETGVCVECDLREADLRFLDLRGVVLRGSDLSNANFFKLT
jgi:uncharacterized protein YjbI with pentapeptide repeats